MLGGQHGSDSSLTRTVANCEQGMHTEGRLVLTVLVVSLVVIFLVRTAPPSEPEPKPGGMPNPAPTDVGVAQHVAYTSVFPRKKRVRPQCVKWETISNMLR